MEWNRYVILKGGNRSVRLKDYVDAKTAQLKEFGYESLTKNDVEEKTIMWITGNELTDVISRFIQGDLEQETK